MGLPLLLPTASTSCDDAPVATSAAAPRAVARSRAHTVSVSACTLVLVLAAGLSGCASSSGGGIVDKTLELVGLKKPEPPDLTRMELPVLPKKVTLRIHAGEQVNSDTNARSLSIVIRVYKLKGTSAFLLAPYEAFRDTDSERKALGSDLIDVRELVLTPGQKHEVVETMPIEATQLGVVALFRAPADGRWRFAFDTKAAEKTGVTLGVHGCAMSVAAGEPVNAPPEVLRLAGVRCR